MGLWVTWSHAGTHLGYMRYATRHDILNGSTSLKESQDSLSFSFDLVSFKAVAFALLQSNGSLCGVSIIDVRFCLQKRVDAIEDCSVSGSLERSPQFTGILIRISAMIQQDSEAFFRFRKLQRSERRLGLPTWHEC